MSYPPGQGPPDPTGPPPGWPAAPPYQQPQPPPPPISAPPWPADGSPQAWPPQYRHPAPPDPRWSGSKMFFVVFGVLTATGPVLGSLYGLLIGGIIGRAIVDSFGGGPVDESTTAFGMIVGAFGGGFLGLMVGLVAGMVGGGIATGLMRRTTPVVLGLSAASGAAVVAGLAAFGWSGGGLFNDAGAVIALGLVPTALAGLVTFLAAWRAAVRAEAVDRSLGGPPTP